MTRRKMTGYLVLLTIAAMVACNGNGVTPEPEPPPEWPGTRQFGSVDVDAANAVAVDGQGNIAVAGSVRESLLGNFWRGGDDVFLLTFGPDGVVRWAHQFGTVANDVAADVTVDSAGNLYIVGSTFGDMNAVNSTWTGPFLGSSVGNEDVFVAKFDPNGVPLWLHQFGTNDFDRGVGIAVADDGRIYVTGSTRGALGPAFFGGEDIFLARFDNNGNQLEFHQFGTLGFDQAGGIAIDGNGDIVLTGNLQGELDLSQIGLFFGERIGNRDAFVASFSAEGQPRWLHQFGTSGNDSGQGVAVADDGMIYVAGTLGEGNDNIFLARLNASGNEILLQLVGSQGNDQAFDVAVDGNNNIYVTGVTNGEFEPGAPASIGDAVLVKFDASGELEEPEWRRQFGTPDLDEGRGVAVGSDGNIFVAGVTGGEMQVKIGTHDAFLAKFEPVDGILVGAD